MPALIDEATGSHRVDLPSFVTIALPSVILGFFIVVPLFDHWLSRRLSGLLRVSVMVGGLGAWGWLTFTSLATSSLYLLASQIGALGA